MRKKLVLAALVVTVCAICGCGTTYTCEECGTKTKDAYYNPLEDDEYFCKECAIEFFAGWPYEDYSVN